MKKLFVSCLALVAVSGSAFSDVRVRTLAPTPAGDGDAVRIREIKPLDPPPSAGYSPCAFSIVPTLSWPEKGYDIGWFRFNLLMGYHRSVRGFDLGVLANMAEYESSGLALSALFNSTGISKGALHVAGLFNYADWQFDGVQLAGGLSDAEGALRGMQLAAITSCGRLTGLQVGAFNYAERGVGVQVGVVNCSEQLSGLQIGLVNLNLDSSVPVLPIINIAFSR